MKNWHTCQLCGRVTHRSQADGWLVSPRRTDETVLVIRCPWCISEWALRQSQAGRTKEWRQRMREAGDPPPIPPSLSPYPMKDDD